MPAAADGAERSDVSSSTRTAAVDAPESPEELARIWASRRIEAAELIWGEDFIAPGGAEYAVTLAKPLALTPAMSVLDLGVGLGGGTRALADSFGIWVTGLERDPDLLKEANSRSRNVALEKKSPLNVFDPDQLDLKMQSADCIVSRELFHTVSGKKRLFGMMHAALKDRGQLLFTDYVSGPSTTGTAFAEWAKGERVPSHPVPPQELQAIMKENGFNCRIAHDGTDDYRALIMSAWTNLARKLEQGAVPRHLLGRVMEEAERWTKLMRAFDSGELRSYRFHAFRT